MNTKNFIISSLLTSCAILNCPELFGFDDTQVLPKGVRGLTIKSINTSGDSISDPNGQPIPVAAPLNKSLSFKEIIKNEHTTRKTKVEGFLKEEGIDSSESVGDFHADMAANVTVVAPVIAYGLSEKTTMAIAIPYFQANVTTSFGFSPTPKAQLFLDKLASPKNNQIPEARLAGEKLNDVYGELNSTLDEWGYEKLEDWSDSGVGDITIGAKHRAINANILKLAALGGITLPTGRVDDPDILNDIPFGYGTYDFFAGAILEQKVNSIVSFAQYGKYTYRMPSKGTFRKQTAEDEFEVEKEEMNLKLGDKMEAGVSVNSEASGFISGVGIIQFHKLGDNYQTDNILVERELERETNQTYTQLEARVGYSSIKAFQEGRAKVPFLTTLELKRYANSTNTPVGDFITFDISVFF